MAKPGKTGLTRIFNAFIYSKQGLSAGLRHEAAMRQELMLAVPMTVAAFFIAQTAAELALLIIMPWLTFCAEVLNSAIEAVVDRIGDEYHELSGRAKDLGSACVLIMLTLSGLTWLIIVGSRLGWWF